MVSHSTVLQHSGCQRAKATTQPRIKLLLIYQYAFIDGPVFIPVRLCP